jgi:type II secretory pathway pseudopilin PulG
MRGGEAGSALVEALVATAIVAGVLGAMFESLSAADARRSAIDQRRTALMIARSRLAAIGSEIPVVPGEIDGVEGDFSWRVHVEPTQSDTVAVSRVGAPDLVTVAVRPSRGGNDLVTLKSLRLAAQP